LTVTRLTAEDIADMIRQLRKLPFVRDVAEPTRGK
jgi:hypothetical protein